MKRLSFLVAGVLSLLLVSGCATQTIRPISQQVVIEDDDSRSTIVDVKLDKYTKLVAEFPKEPKYQERLARLYWEKSDHTNALKALAKARKFDPDNPKYHYLAAKIYEGIGSYSAAEQSYLSVINSSGGENYSGPMLQLSILYMEMERSDKAFALLNRCLEVDPTFADPHYWLGRIHMQQRNRPKAIKSFERYLRVGGEARQKEVLQTLQALQPDLRIHDIR